MTSLLYIGKKPCFIEYIFCELKKLSAILFSHKNFYHAFFIIRDAIIAAVSVLSTVLPKEIFSNHHSKNAFSSSLCRQPSGPTSIIEAFCFFSLSIFCKLSKTFFHSWWATKTFFSLQNVKISFTKITSGIFHHHDCSTASNKIFCKRSFLLSEISVSTERLEGNNTICCIHTSAHFCTMSSSFSNLFGSATQRNFSSSINFFSSSFITLTRIFFFSIDEISHLILLYHHCSETLSHSLARNTLESWCSTLSSVRAIWSPWNS